MRVTNSDIYTKLEVLTERVKNMQEDLDEIKLLVPRVRQLELFKSYTLGCVAVIGAAGGAILSVFKL